ncbi:hypothetical protein AN963_21260 [Brevibacillus choshinensis]|uniref:RND transporter n=1 Tax=Brevibacillus choshinensis TaxID=54911 RepID=A0ABR5N117_BRECH|nr:efflux RND transporter periplasmic adaptor subunit [Brevibacillus choshinensis]KQL43978.1 hypothetical protein AN963_21260 [Brevibacillus choshinensis]
MKIRKSSILLVLSLGLLLSGCTSPREESVTEQKKEKIVAGVTISKNNQAIVEWKSGEIKPRERVEPSFGVSGKITTINVHEGQYVKKGTLLATIDAGVYATASQAANTAIGEAIARRERLLKGADDESRKQQKIRIQSAERNLTEAQTNLNKMNRLYAADAISKDTLTSAENALKTAEEAFRTEQLTWDKLVKAPEQEALAGIDSNIAQARNSSAQASNGLTGTKIIAPFDGTISDVWGVEGDQAVAGSRVLELVDLGELKVTVAVETGIRKTLSAGAKVIVKDEDGKEREGRIHFISPMPNQSTGKYEVEVRISNGTATSATAWLGGRVAKVGLPRHTEGGYLIGIESVGIGEGGNWVLVIKDGKLEQRKVTTGETFGDVIEVTKGLREGERVVKSGVSFLLPGEKVREVNANE